MANDLNQELIRRMLDAQANPVADFDPTAITKAATNGLDLANTIQTRKQSQEDRIKKLAEEIEKTKRGQSLVGEISKRSPLAGKAADVNQDEAAKQVLQLEFDEKAKQSLKNERPDNLKQILQVGDRTIGVTYGGQIKDIPLGGRAQPLVAPQLPAVQAGDMAQLGQVVKKLQRAKQLFDASKTPTGESPLVGLMDNALNRAKEFAGNPDVEATEFRTLITNNINQQIKAITGAQLSEAEAQRIMKALPSMNLGEAAFEQRLKDAIKVTEDIIREKQGAFSGFSGVPNILPGNEGTPLPAGNPGSSGLSPEQRRARIAELKAKQAQGTLR